MSDDTNVPASSWWYVAMLALAIVILALLARPCELYRLKVFIKHSEFGWGNTVCAPMQDRGCHCITAATMDPWVIGEWTMEPARMSAPKQDVFPAVVF